MSSISKRQDAKNQQFLRSLIQLPANSTCADCRNPNPLWASWSLGCFLCMRCAGLHRKMGTHISKVKSISLDTWTPEQLNNMKELGNEKSNAIW
ncbi:Arf GTPase activating protein, partial [Saitoella complicata NRRL Y-17804]